MTTVRLINCGRLHLPPSPRVPCQCLLLEESGRLALVDTGIGLQDCKHPLDRIGQQFIDMAGFQFGQEDTAIKQIETLGFRAENVEHIILTHGDPDHAGGLADFPKAKVHVTAEELSAIQMSGHWRYRQTQFSHRPVWNIAASSHRSWFGMEARPLSLGFDSEVLLIPLFGHTIGHAGVAVQQGDRWILHVGDAIYLHAELESDEHPVSELAAQRASDDSLRRVSIERLRVLICDHRDKVQIVTYHELTELTDAEAR